MDIEVIANGEKQPLLSDVGLIARVHYAEENLWQTRRHDVIGLQNLIRREDSLVHVAEERERNANLLSKSGVGCATLYAYSGDDRVTWRSA